MASLDLCPTKGMYRAGDPVHIQAQADGLPARPIALRLSIIHLTQVIAELDETIRPEAGHGTAIFEWQPPALAGRGYGVEGRLEAEGRTPLARASTAFDVLSSWTAFPRYGFLTDFFPERKDIDSTVDRLARYHINGLQFYDWQYRHDTLVAPAQEYEDPLGRRLSLATVRGCVDAARARGMACMGYVAIYAASRSFWEDHPDWTLRDASGSPIPFGDRFLGLMDPSAHSPWVDHLLAEAGRAVDTLAFDGLHVDQYGDPKVAYRPDGRRVDLPQAFAAFVDAFKAMRPEASVVFNTIDGWPLEHLGQSKQDFAYLEIWPRQPGYRDLRTLLMQARRETHGQPLVVAQYLPADREENIRLVNALIAGCGGTRIELGEDERLLTDPYFPNHSPMAVPLLRILRRHYDFVVRYGELIGPSAAEADDIRINGPSGVWVFPRRSPGWIACALINLEGIESSRWDRAHPAPAAQAPFTLEVALPRPPLGTWWASPDEGRPNMRRLDWSSGAGCIRIEVPTLSRWGLVAIQVGQE